MAFAAVFAQDPPSIARQFYLCGVTGLFISGDCRNTEEHSHEGTHCLGGHGLRIVKPLGLASEYIAGSFGAGHIFPSGPTRSTDLNEDDFIFAAKSHALP